MFNKKTKRLNKIFLGKMSHKQKSCEKLKGKVLYPLLFQV